MADEDLVAAAQRGDLSAFNHIVEQHQVGVYNLCLRMLGSPQAAEDASQETFFAAYRSIRTYRGGSFRGWLLRIASNHCLDQLRARRRRPSEPLSDELPLPDPAPGPVEAALSAENVTAIEQALLRLPPDQRLCVLLVDVQGLDYAEASLAMDTQLGTVKSRLSRARAALRELLPADIRPIGGE